MLSARTIVRFERCLHWASEIVGFSTVTETTGATTPTDIELDSRGRRVRIVWGDGRRSDYDWEFLRWRCPCATCSGEAEFVGELQSRTELQADETEMVDLELVGRYAVKPTWRNGHDTGIFTWRNLRALAENEKLFGE
jgi:DUF971 family protein